MSIDPDEMMIIKTALHYSVLLKRETQKDEEFKDIPSVKSQLDTEIYFIEQLRDELEEKVEEDLMDDSKFCMALSDALIFLTGYHKGRIVTNEMENDIDPIKKIQEKFCKKKAYEYY